MRTSGRCCKKVNASEHIYCIVMREIFIIVDTSTFPEYPGIRVQRIQREWTPCRALLRTVEHGHGAGRFRRRVPEPV